MKTKMLEKYFSEKRKKLIKTNEDKLKVLIEVIKKLCFSNYSKTKWWLRFIFIQSLFYNSFNISQILNFKVSKMCKIIHMLV
jgi:hypothetical protein